MQCYVIIGLIGNAIFFLKCILFYVCEYFASVCVYMCTMYISDAHRGLKRALDHLELELPMAVKHHVVLGIEPLSSIRATSV